MVKSVQPSQRQLLSIKKTANVDLNFSNFFSNLEITKFEKKILSKQKCSLLPVLRDSFGCRYGLIKIAINKLNCCVNEQSASHVCMTEKVWSSIILFSFTYKFLSFTEEERRRTENVLIYFDRKPVCRSAFLFRKHQSLIRLRSGMIF